MSRPTEDTAMRAVTAQLGAHTLQGYWAVVPYKNGLVSFRESPGGGAFVPETHRIYAIELSNVLNREIAFGGKWIVCWSEFDLKEGWPRHLAMLWMDKDGDVPFVVDSDEDHATQVYGMIEYVHQCAEAYATWRDMMKDVGVGEHQKIAAGLGQRSVNENAAPDVIAAL
jgi:hypothetical protein